MLGRVWKAIARWFRRLLGMRTPPQTSPPGKQTGVKIQRLSDEVYQQLFSQMLTGVSQGWNQAQVLQHLGNRVNDRFFRDWLRDYGIELRQLPEADRQVALRLLRLSQVGCGEIGEIAAEIGRDLLTKPAINAERDTPTKEVEKVEPVTLNELDDAEAWFDRGNDRYMAGDFEGAIASFDKAIEFKLDFHAAWNNRGSALNNLGRFEEAIASFDKAIEFKPDKHEVWSNRGSALGNLGQFEEAIASFDKAIEFKPDKHEVWSNRGSALGNLGQFEEAIASFDKAIEFKLDFHEAWNNRGLALDNLGRFEEAIASFDKAIEFKLDFHEAWNNRGLALDNLGRFEEAITSFDKAIEFKLDKHEAWFNRGSALDNLGRFEEAIASFDKAIEFKLDYHEAWSNRGSALCDLGRFEEAIASFDKAIEFKLDYHEACYNRGTALCDLGRFEEAIASFDKAIEFKPDFHEAWFNRGLALDNLGRFEEAIASFDKAIEFKPDLHEAWSNRGSALNNLGRFEEAIASYDKAIEFKLDKHEAWNNRGSALDNLGRFEEAIASYDKAIEFKLDKHEAWFNRGSALFNLGRFEEAIASYDKAIEFKLDKHEAWNNRGLALGNLGRFEEAIASYDKAIEFKLDYHEACYNRGTALCDLGRFEEAIASFDKAIEFKPDFHEAWFNRGLALDNLGRFEEAIASFDKAIEFKPDLHEAWSNRGSALNNLGRFEEAIASYDKAIEFKLDKHEAWNNRGSALDNLGRFEEAIASYDKAIEFKLDKHEAWFNRGSALFNLGRFEEAIASYDKAIEFKLDKHEAWNNRGLALGNLGRFEEAIASYDKAIEFKLDFHEAWYNRGIALDGLGRFEEAIASYDKAIEFKLDYHEAWNNRGLALGKSGRFEEAIASYGKAIEFKLDFHEAWSNRGSALFNLGRFEEAIASYGKAIEFKLDFHEAWIGRGIAAGKSAVVETNFAFKFNLPAAATYPNLALTLNNPALNWRGYEGRLASFRQGLQHCLQDTHPEGWGRLNHAIGQAHYFQSHPAASPRPYWRQAKTEYYLALETLTKEAFPQLHLEVLQDLIKVLLGLGETEKATELKRQGTDLLQRLLDEKNLSDLGKKQLALKFASFNQLTVDILVQSNQLTAALETAESGKNACLGWLLNGWSDDESPPYSEMQKLANSTTAVIYWHLSPYALHTFIIKPILPPFTEKPKKEETFVETRYIASENLAETQSTTSENLADTQSIASGTEGVRCLREFEKWVEDWNEQYTDYGSKTKNEASRQNHPWRKNLEEKLKNLKKILEIPAATLEELKASGIDKLILIPHRDLHRFPLHCLFDNFTVTYLPSAKTGLNLQNLYGNEAFAPFATQQLLSVEHPDSHGFTDIIFAEIEAVAITQLFRNPTRIDSENATKVAVLDILQATSSDNTHNRPHPNPLLIKEREPDTGGSKIFQFTGHGVYEFSNPKLSYLALSGTDKLTVEDILQLPLTGYQLVCLSACETAVTSNQTITTEYVGLVSAFIRQGVRYVVSTLWTVESNASALLMIKFYRLLKLGVPAPVALKKAQNWLQHLTCGKLIRIYQAVISQLPDDERQIRRFLKNRIKEISTIEKSQKLYEAPYHWAAFTITGLPTNK